MADLKRLTQAMAALDEDLALRIIREVDEKGGGEAAQALIACQEGLQEVGARYETGD